jgi:hypothetical protein
MKRTTLVDVRGVALSPTWRAPHHFTLVAVEGSSDERGLGTPVYTYPLVTTAFASGLDAETAAPIGWEWLATMTCDAEREALRAEALTAEAEALDGRGLTDRSLETLGAALGVSTPRLPDPPLATFLREGVGVTTPGLLPPRRSRETTIPADLLRRHVASEQGRLADRLTQIEPFARDLQQHARSGSRPGDPPSDPHRLLDLFPPTLAFWPLRDPSRTSHEGRGARAAREETFLLRFTNLMHRIALEVFELYTLRPSLRLCAYCGRPFVQRPGKRDTYCRAQLWAADAQLGDAPIRYCSEALELAVKETAAPSRTRQRKTSYQQVLRAVQRAGLTMAEAKSVRATGTLPPEVEGAFRRYEKVLGSHETPTGAIAAGQKRGPAPRPIAHD